MQMYVLTLVVKPFWARNHSRTMSITKGCFNYMYIIDSDGSMNESTPLFRNGGIFSQWPVRHQAIVRCL